MVCAPLRKDVLRVWTVPAPAVPGAIRSGMGKQVQISTIIGFSFVKNGQKNFWDGKETGIREKSENFPLQFKIDMLVLYSLKIASFPVFDRKSRDFLDWEQRFFGIFDFSILTKEPSFSGALLVQNKQGGGANVSREGIPADRCAQHAIKIHFGGI